MLDRVKPEKREEFRRKFNEPGNYFKHADWDSKKILEFDPTISEFYLWDCCNLYKQIVGDSPQLIVLYTSWFLLKHKDLLLEGEYKSKVEKLLKTINPDNRTEFYAILSKMKDY
jgi:hypothetical protein